MRKESQGRIKWNVLMNTRKGKKKGGLAHLPRENRRLVKMLLKEKLPVLKEF